MEAAHGSEVVGEGVGVSRFQLLNQELDVSCDEFLLLSGFLLSMAVTLVVALLLMVFAPYMPNAT